MLVKVDFALVILIWCYAKFLQLYYLILLEENIVKN